MEEYYNLLNNKIKHKVYMVEINEYKYFLEEEKKEIDRINIIYNKLKMDLNIRNNIRNIFLHLLTFQTPIIYRHFYK